MKYFVAFLVSVLLVACGGGDETPVAVIKASVPRPAANAATVSGGSGVVVHMYQALYGMAPSNEMLLNYTAQATADPSTFARNLTSNFASTSSTALAKLVLDNLGVTATTVTAMNGQGQSEYAILLDALGQMFTFYGADARGQIILNATNLLAGLESDPTYGVAAASYNNQATVNFSYSSNSAKAEGVYGGTITGSTSTAFETLVLENGDLWSLYGTQTSSIFSVAGFVQGSGTSNNGSFTSSNAKDFGFAPAVAGTLTATYDATAKTISGTVSAGTQTATFSGGPIAGSLYNYNTAAALTTVVGAWSTTSLTGEGVALTVASTGAFTAASSLGCHFTGTITPRASGKNVFNVAMTFGAAPCALPGQSATGIALAYPLTSGKTQLLVSAVDGTRSYGAAVFGTR